MNGFSIRTPAIVNPCGRSSVSRVSQAASRAAATIRASARDSRSGEPRQPGPPVEVGVEAHHLADSLAFEHRNMQRVAGRE